ncbi:MAG: S9 family peptidase [Gemmatimonadota bacterium]|nr:S9 family peptidase [Gemmatimonadota bacterium]
MSGRRAPVPLSSPDPARRPRRPRARSCTRATVALVACLAVPAIVLDVSTAGAQQADGTLSLETWLDWERVSDPQISPDGSRVIYTLRWVDKLNDRWESSVWIVNADGTRNRHLVDGASPIWSPTGDRIAFTRSDEDGNAQIFVRWMDAEGAVSQVTRLTESPSDIEWSPDGTRLSFTMRTPAENPTSRNWSIDLPRPEGAEWTRSPRIIERLVYRQDRVGFLEESFEQIFVVSADGGTPRQLTRGDMNHGAPTWEPSGESLLFSALLAEDADYRWAESEIYRIDARTGAIEQVTTRRGPDGRPVPSPDGTMIAYVGRDTTTLDYAESAVYVMDADGSNPRALTAEMDRSPGALFWAPDGSGIYFNVSADGYANIHFASLDGAVTAMSEGPQMFGIADVSSSGRAVGMWGDAHEPGDVYAFPVDAPSNRTRLTAVNSDVLHGVQLGDVEQVWTESSYDGLPIHGWVIKPPGFDPSREYPMMLVIHGGPHGMYDGGFDFGWQEHAANGYVVLYTNPRGSSGYGTEFGNAIQYDYPNHDFDDLMSTVDEVVGRGYVDESNMFVYGCSGGGVLTAWVVGHTDRFRAASSNCPVINWFSFVGEVDGNYLRWYADFENFPWEDPSEHIRRSPLMYVGNVTTPTMLMTGVNDMRTPISQTEQFYQALKVLNKRTAMIRFEGEWHGTSSRPSNFLRTQLYLRKWFERWGDHDDGRVTTTDQGG